MPPVGASWRTNKLHLPPVFASLWRFFKSSAARMGDEEYSITLCHGTSRHEVVVRGTMTLEDLASMIEELTNVLHNSQKIIHRGKTLSQREVTLASCGVGPGAKLMVLGRKHEHEDNNVNFQAVLKIEESCIKVERRLNDIVPDVEGISQGYVEARLCGEALTRLRKQLLCVNEDFMRHLEQLDGVNLQETDVRARQRRKALVKKIQKFMERCDQVQENIDQLMLSYT
ncbi:BAG family molecular chaperone regulator 1 [Chionoecetes opilio]|uniref:BAG family molecular chaperone regulator 1 n=1 Tax=Chionoecetes opilio TaxID=41210 RepID=A0A8J4XLX2_CHIOP|nr:BAG family molecular chaperone regulator 1 [Chionoecetes opilio]